MTKLPKKGQLVKQAGAARRRVLSVIFLMLRKSMTKEKYAAKLGLSKRTVERVLDDAKSVGFQWTADKSGRIVLKHGRK